MNVIFNELSFLPYSDNEYILKENFAELLSVFEKAKQSYGITHLVFPTNIGEHLVTSTKTFLQWVYNIPNQGEKNRILSVIRRPFGNEVLAEQLEDLSKFYYRNDEAGIQETYCCGLATAYLKELLCLSLSNTPIWSQITINFKRIINENFDTEDVSVHNISRGDHLRDQAIKSYIEYIGDVKLEQTDENPLDKQIALRDDHGKDKLLLFSKKIVRSKYVRSVINSLPFNPKAINLIRKVYPDGKIEMVLHWEDNGIGLVIQTTGRNYRETEAIAHELRKEFDR